MKMKSRFVFFAVIFLLFCPDCFSATYHIDPSAGDGGSGSATSPYNSWADLPSMATGDDVFFKCGTWYAPSSNISINWNGTSSNPVIIGAYYISGSTPVYGVSSSGRPTISGSSWSVPSNACYGSSNSYDGLIDISNRDYIHVKNLRIYRSGFRGINIEGDLDVSNYSSQHFYIYNVKTEASYAPGILSTENSWNYGVIEACEVVGSGHSYDAGCESDWPVSLASFSSPYAYITIKDNYVHENYGEGIGSGRVRCVTQAANTGYALIENNVVWSNRRVDIYLDGAENNIVRGNVCVGGSNAEYTNAYVNDRHWNQAGIYVNTENRGTACAGGNNNNNIYNNFVANHYRGLALLDSLGQSLTLSNILMYNNVSIANAYNYYSGGLSTYTLSNVQFKNNVSYCPAGTYCTDFYGSLDWEVDADYNSREAYVASWAGAHDNTTDNYWQTTSGWQTLTQVPDKDAWEMTGSNTNWNDGTSMYSWHKTEIYDSSSGYTPVYPDADDIPFVTEQSPRSSDIWHIGAVKISDNQHLPVYDGQKVELPVFNIVSN